MNEQKTFSVEPTTQIVKTLSYSGYTLKSALADIIDNSIGAGASEVKINFNFDSVTNIAACAFNNCRKIEEIVLGSNLARIEGSAFAYCMSLKSITYNGSVEQWEAIEKGMLWNNATGNYTVYCNDGSIAK